jgi:hypothetical protein
LAWHIAYASFDVYGVFVFIAVAGSSLSII